MLTRSAPFPCFPATGQVEHVARIHRELARMASIERRGKLAADEEGRGPAARAVANAANSPP